MDNRLTTAIAVAAAIIIVGAALGGSLARFTPPAPSGNSAPGPRLIGKDEADQTLTLALHDRFAFDLGNELSWSPSFDPSAAVRPVPGLPGVYEVVLPGTVAVTALGAPVCKAGTPCPQFRVRFSVTLAVSP